MQVMSQGMLYVLLHGRVRDDVASEGDSVRPYVRVGPWRGEWLPPSSLNNLDAFVLLAPPCLYSHYMFEEYVLMYR